MARADIEDALVRLEQVHKQLGALSTGAEPGWEKLGGRCRNRSTDCARRMGS